MANMFAKNLLTLLTHYPMFLSPIFTFLLALISFPSSPISHLLATVQERSAWIYFASTSKWTDHCDPIEMTWALRLPKYLKVCLKLTKKLDQLNDKEMGKYLVYSANKYHGFFLMNVVTFIIHEFWYPLFQLHTHCLPLGIDSGLRAGLIS